MVVVSMKSKSPPEAFRSVSVASVVPNVISFEVPLVNVS